MSDDIRWIRSYVLEEGNSAVGSVCIYQATSPDAAPRPRFARRPAHRRGHPRRGHGAGAPGPGARRWIDPAQRLTILNRALTGLAADAVTR